ncbi:MAG TPA: hypothetical protein VKQ07_08730, partial [Jatrophihabitantaceae bacterium]|nr:hypothetical protein [Jatrophihabitantaceae bacterium]
IGRIERAIRRSITRSILSDVAKLRGSGVRVRLVTPEADDLALMGINLMDPEHRTDVLTTAQRTAAAQLRRQLAGQHAARRRATGRAAGETTA